MRGTVLRAFRALVLLDVAARLFQTTPDKRLHRLRQQLTAVQADARKIRLMIAKTEREIRNNESCASEQSGDGAPCGDPKID